MLTCCCFVNKPAIGEMPTNMFLLLKPAGRPLCRYGRKVSNYY